MYSLPSQERLEVEGRQHMCKSSKYKCLLWTEAGVWTARGLFVSMFSIHPGGRLRFLLPSLAFLGLRTLGKHLCSINPSSLLECIFLLFCLHIKCTEKLLYQSSNLKDMCINRFYFLNKAKFHFLRLFGGVKPQLVHIF